MFYALASKIVCCVNSSTLGQQYRGVGEGGCINSSTLGQQSPGVGEGGCINSSTLGQQSPGVGGEETYSGGTEEDVFVRVEGGLVESGLYPVEGAVVAERCLRPLRQLHNRLQ